MLRTFRILFIEDEAVTAEIVSQYLNRYNFTVTHIEDGRQAPGLLRDNTFDLMILDLMMPAVDGFTILESMRRTSDLKMPVLIASARSDKEAVLRVKELRADGYLSKPVSEQQLIEKITIALGISPDEIIDKRKHTFTSRIWQDENAVMRIELSGIPNAGTPVQMLQSVTAAVKMVSGIRHLWIDVAEHFVLYPQHFPVVRQIAEQAQTAMRFGRLNTRLSGEYLKYLNLDELTQLRNLAKLADQPNK